MTSNKRNYSIAIRNYCWIFY